MKRKALAQTLLAAAALIYLAAMVASGARPRHGQFVAFEAEGVMAADPARVETVNLRAGTHRWQLHLAAGAWRLGTQPLAADAAAHLERALKYLHTARPVRRLEGDDLAPLSEYGLAAPALSVSVGLRDGGRFAADFGKPSNDGMLQYLRVDGDPATCLMSRFVGEEWQALAEALPE